MKLLYFFAVLLLTTCNNHQGVNQGVILFTHTGIANHITIPLYISTKHIDIHLNKQQMDDFKSMVGDTVKNKNEYIDIKFDKIVTDSKTFYYLSTFITNSDKFYTTHLQQNNNPAAESYNININGRNYSIYYKFKNDFFNQLKIYLIKRNCDHKVIQALSYL